MVALEISSGACLVLEDRDGTKLGQIEQVGEAFGLEIPQQDFVNECISKAGNGRFFDLYPGTCAENEAGNKTCTLDRELKETLNMITIEFDKIKELPEPNASKVECPKSITDPSLKATMENLINQFDEHGDKIKELQQLVTESFLTPANKLKNDTGCKYLRVPTKAVINSFCYEGIYGLYIITIGYLTSGVAATVLGLLMFLIWRHSTDNRREWSRVDDCADGPKLRRGHYTFRI